MLPLCSSLQSTLTKGNNQAENPEAGRSVRNLAGIMSRIEQRWGPPSAAGQANKQEPSSWTTGVSRQLAQKSSRSAEKRRCESGLRRAGQAYELLGNATTAVQQPTERLNVTFVANLDNERLRLPTDGGLQVAG
jgi:hypothetical protein